jgi:hypothetical protein
LRDRATRNAALIPQRREEGYYPHQDGNRARNVHLLNARVQDVNTVD